MSLTKIVQPDVDALLYRFNNGLITSSLGLLRVLYKLSYVQHNMNYVQLNVVLTTADLGMFAYTSLSSRTKYLKGIIVNCAFPFLHQGLLEITLTVPLSKKHVFRLSTLSKKYKFECNCMACKEEWNTYQLLPK